MMDELEGEENYEEVLTGLLAQPPRRGRPMSIDDDSLLRRRESLLGFLDGWWGEVGWELETARAIKDIRKALKPLDRGLQHPIQVFTRNTKTKTTSAQLRLRIKEVAAFNETVRATSRAELEYRKSLETVTAASEQINSKTQMRKITPVLKQRAADHNAVQKKYAELLQKLNVLEKQFENERAFVAQTELLDFLDQRRYAFNPVNLANAMAGLPDISWRQSWKRCVPHKSRLENSANDWMFKFISSSIAELDLQTNKLPLVDFVKLKLQKHKNSTDYRIMEAKKNWHHLDRAIKAVSRKRHHPGALPYRILAGYQKNLQSKTPMDLFREEQEQLT